MVHSRKNNEVKRVFVLVPDGVGIKNYLYSNVFKGGNFSIGLLHNFDKDTLAEIGKTITFEQSHQLPQYKEGIREKFLRELIHLSRLKHNAAIADNITILKFWKREHKSTKLKLFYKAVTLASSRIRSYEQIESLEVKYDAAIRKNPFYHKIKELLQELNPDTLFCTHQRAIKAPAVFAAARDLGIQTSTVIYSWDNIPKARLALRADAYLVWSTYMKKELQYFYPDISSNDIIVTGTPQFEFYYNTENIIPKEEFFNRYKIDPNKKLICFSGDDVRTSPYDPEYLNDLAEAIKRSGMNNNYQILFRRCPVDLSGRYDRVLQQYPGLIVEMPPLWNFNAKKWTAVYPTIEDVHLLVSLAYYADVVINVGSTMAFDFGMFNKPCIYINYDHVEDPNWSVKTIYNYQHFRSMPHQNSVYWFDDSSEIPKVIEAAVGDTEGKITNWFKIIAEYPESASEKIRKALS
jgi:hypothetical protein